MKYVDAQCVDNSEWRMDVGGSVDSDGCSR